MIAWKAFASKEEDYGEASAEKRSGIWRRETVLVCIRATCICIFESIFNIFICNVSCMKSRIRLDKNLAPR